MNNFEVDINKILKSGLGFEAYFILYCLYTNDEQLISSYTNKCKKINIEIFKELEKTGYIRIKTNNTGKIYYGLLSLTDKGQSLLLNNKSYNGPTEEAIPLKSENNFEEFRTFYPMSVKDGFSTRRLHKDLKRCKATYDKLLLETTHDLLCKCAKLYHEEKYNSNSLKYMQDLSVWLNQKNYLMYLEDAKQLKETNNNTITETTNLDAI